MFEQRLPRFAPEERARGWHVQYDALQKDHCFVRDPSTLRLYDPETVRVALQLRHRDVEELEGKSRALRQGLDETSRALAAAQASSSALSDAVQAHAAERDALQRRLDEQAQQLGEVRELLRRQQREAERQRLASASEQHALQERILDLEGTLTAMSTSNSWRVTAPLRAARRLLTRG